MLSSGRGGGELVPSQTHTVGHICACVTLRDVSTAQLHACSSSMLHTCKCAQAARRGCVILSKVSLCVSAEKNVQSHAITSQQRYNPVSVDWQ